jgi:hypothetical protein
LIKQTCIDIFNNQLHWEIANLFQSETFGENRNSDEALKLALVI